MTGAPDAIVLKRDRDLIGRSWEVWVRRAIFTLLPIVSILALLNVFGQRPKTATAASDVARLEVYAPTHVRSGLLFSARFHITAVQELKQATLVLHPGWVEGMSVNTIEPSPISEGSANGWLSLQLGHIRSGQSYLLFMQFQVNPTNVGHRPQTVVLLDGKRKLLELHREITIFP